VKKFFLISLAAATLATVGAGSAFAQQRPLGDKDRDGIPNAVDPHDDRWDPAWGAQVMPPRGWNHKRHWNHHVGACRTKYATYDAHRDMYQVHKKWVRCTIY
jgi:hypothetical protein